MGSQDADPRLSEFFSFNTFLKVEVHPGPAGSGFGVGAQHQGSCWPIKHNRIKNILMKNMLL